LKRRNMVSFQQVASRALGCSTASPGHWSQTGTAGLLKSAHAIHGPSAVSNWKLRSRSLNCHPPESIEPGENWPQRLKIEGPQRLPARQNYGYLNLVFVCVKPQVGDYFRETQKIVVLGSDRDLRAVFERPPRDRRSPDRYPKPRPIPIKSGDKSSSRKVAECGLAGGHYHCPFLKFRKLPSPPRQSTVFHAFPPEKPLKASESPPFSSNRAVHFPITV
jgi:hypothetical protein